MPASPPSHLNGFTRTNHYEVLALPKKQRECQRRKDQYFVVFFFGAPAFFSVFFSPGAIVPEVTVPPVAIVDIVPPVPEVSVALIVPVVAVLDSSVPVVVVAVLVAVTPVSVAAVSVFAFSSFLQPKAKIAIATKAITVTTRDFLSFLLFLSYT